MRRVECEKAFQGISRISMRHKIASHMSVQIYNELYCTVEDIVFVCTRLCVPFIQEHGALLV